MAIIEFKSVGESVETTTRAQADRSDSLIGIMTPLRPGIGRDGLFAMHHDIANQITDNLRNLIMTNHGERLGLYDFGANLRELSFESGQDDFDSQAVIRIKTTVNKYMPFVNLSTFESKPTPNKAGNIDRVDIKITYNVPRLGVRQRELIATIFVRG